MVLDTLCSRHGIAPDDIDVRRHEPEDFLVRFRRWDDYDRVLATRHRDNRLPLIWRPWTRLSTGVAENFTFRVVLALRNVPLHARNLEVAQTILGCCCCDVEPSRLRDRPEDDDREFFVQAWCRHPSLIEPEKLLHIPEPTMANAAPAELDLRRGLRYRVQVRVVAQQDMEALQDPSDDDGDDNDGMGGPRTTRRVGMITGSPPATTPRTSLIAPTRAMAAAILGATTPRAPPLARPPTRRAPCSLARSAVPSLHCLGWPCPAPPRQTPC